jgi:hypothetical protein
LREWRDEARRALRDEIEEALGESASAPRRRILPRRGAHGRDRGPSSRLEFSGGRIGWGFEGEFGRSPSGFCSSAISSPPFLLICSSWAIKFSIGSILNIPFSNLSASTKLRGEFRSRQRSAAIATALYSRAAQIHVSKNRGIGHLYESTDLVQKGKLRRTCTGG